ncbi:MAG: dimethylsulfonioproprionate lyase family protein [Pseudomonadota bacterium]
MSGAYGGRMPPPALARLFHAASAYVAATPALARFAAGRLPAAPRYVASPPRRLSMVSRLPAHRGTASRTTQPLVEALIAAAPFLRWQQSYDARSVGERFLQGYGACNIASPEGPFLAEEIRLGIVRFGRGLHYARHVHAPAEIYAVLAGSARFDSDGRASALLAANGLRVHRPRQAHAMTMGPAGLLTLFLWRGEALMAPAVIEGVS